MLFAILLIDIEDVFVARIQSDEVNSSIWEKIVFLTFKSSLTASITRLDVDILSILLVNNITDPFYGWALSEKEFLDYVNDKYTTPSGVHHYEKTQSSGKQSAKEW